MRLLRAGFLLILGPFLLSPSLSLAGPRVCVVSLLGNDDHDQQIHQESLALINRIDPSHAETIDFKLGISGTLRVYNTLRECLTGNYEEVILFAHSKEEVPGKPGILYSETANSSASPTYLFLNDRFFANIVLGSSLRLLTLVVCQSELVMNQYRRFSELLARGDVRVRYAPISPFATWAFSKIEGRQLGGIVPLKSSINLVAESSQAGSRPTDIFCYLYRDPSQPGLAYCDGGRMEIRFANPSDLRAQWVRLTWNQDDQKWWVMFHSPPGSSLAALAQSTRRGNMPLVRIDATRFGNKQFQLNVSPHRP